MATFGNFNDLCRQNPATGAFAWSRGRRGGRAHAPHLVQDVTRTPSDSDREVVTGLTNTEAESLDLSGHRGPEEARGADARAGVAAESRERGTPRAGAGRG